MKKIFLLILISLVLCLIQTSFLPEILGVGFVLNLVFAFSFAWILVDAPITALKSALVAGFLLDVLYGTRMGVSPLIITGGVLLANLVRKYLFRGWISHVLITTLLAYIYHIVIFGISKNEHSTVLLLSLAAGLLSILLSRVYKQLLASRR